MVALTSRAWCQGCAWTAGPGSQLEVNRQAEKHTARGHPTVTHTEPVKASVDAKPIERSTTLSEALKARALVAPLPNYHEDCTEGVVRPDGEEEPCGQLAVAVRMDPNEGEPYPVCTRHARGVMVPLVRVVNASKVEALRDARRFAAEHPIVTRAELDRLRSGIEALADEWEKDSAVQRSIAETIEMTPDDRKTVLRHERIASQHASQARALLAGE